MASKLLQIVGTIKTPQADFNQTDETKSDYIKNKPAPLELDSDPTTSTVGALGQLCINTTTYATFICVAIADDTYTWQKVPTKMSDLGNDTDVDYLDAGKISDEEGI